MDNDLGRVAEGEQALVNEAPTGLHPSGFDPSRFEGKPRWLGKERKRLFAPLWAHSVGYLEAMPDQDLAAFIDACLNVSQINCAWYEYAFAEMLYDTASAIEARRAATLGAVHESAGLQGDAQTS